MSPFLPGQHPALLPQLLYDSSSPSLQFLPSRPLALTSGRARCSLRVAASKLCACWWARRTDKGETHPADIPPGRIWMGESLPCSDTIFNTKKAKTWCLWELLSVCHTGMKLAKGINVMWALPTDRGEAAAETTLKYERTERHSWGNHFHFTNYPSPRTTDQSEFWGLNLAACSMSYLCKPTGTISLNKRKSTWAFLCKSLEEHFPASGGAGNSHSWLRERATP